MRYALLDPRNGPIGPQGPTIDTVVDSLGAAKRTLTDMHRRDYDPPQWLEVYDVAGWDGVSYGDLLGQIHIGPRNGARWESA